MHVHLSTMIHTSHYTAVQYMHYMQSLCHIFLFTVNLLVFAVNQTGFLQSNTVLYLRAQCLPYMEGSETPYMEDTESEL